MGRRFSFFAWAGGKSSARWTDFRRLLILLGGVIALVVVVALARRVWWHGSDHDHEIGPHGGIIVAINDDDPHYHAEFKMEDDGRIRVFLSAEKPEQVVEVKPQIMIARAMVPGDGEARSIVLRPAEVMSAEPKNTSQFWGRITPDLVGRKFTLKVEGLEIENRKFDFAVASGEASDAPERSQAAAAFERDLVLKPRGAYTQEDINASGRDIPSLKYKDVRTRHSTRPKRGDRLCPVSRIKADARITWVVRGKTYQFCCPPCVVDFVALAKDRPDDIVAPEDLVSKQ